METRWNHRRREKRVRYLSPSSHRKKYTILESPFKPNEKDGQL